MTGLRGLLAWLARAALIALLAAVALAILYGCARAIDSGGQHP